MFHFRHGLVVWGTLAAFLLGQVYTFGDPSYPVEAGNIRVIEYGSGDAGENLHVEVTEGTGYLTTPVWTKGDYQVYQNGAPIPATAGVLMASVRENGRLNPTSAPDTRYSIIATKTAAPTCRMTLVFCTSPTLPKD